MSAIKPQEESNLSVRTLQLLERERKDIAVFPRCQEKSCSIMIEKPIPLNTQIVTVKFLVEQMLFCMQRMR